MQVFRFPAAAFIEGQQRLIFQVKHGKGGHDRIIKGNLGIFGPMIGEFAEISFDGLD